ncbi:MAG: hypothetical protein ACOX41_06490 [Anaerovoracaceae bacterium]|jgi:hypothetical protein
MFMQIHLRYTGRRRFVLPLLLTAALCGALLPWAAPARAAQQADVGFGTAALSAPESGPENSDPGYYSSHSWQGQRLYFGRGQLWDLLAVNSRSLLLFSSDVLHDRDTDTARKLAFDSGGSNDWNASSLRAWLNGSGCLQNTAFFDDTERSLIAGPVEIPDRAQMVRRDYGFSGQPDPDGTRRASLPYWLRDPGSGDGYASFVCQFGSVFQAGNAVTDSELAGVRPLLKLDARRVFLTVRGGTVKSTFGAVSTTQASGSQPWLLTVRDGSTGFRTRQPARAVAAKGSVIKVKVTDPGRGTHNHISALLLDHSGHVTAYGFSTVAGTKTGTYRFTVPASLPAGTYRLKIFAENAAQTTADVRSLDTAGSAAASTLVVRTESRPARAAVSRLRGKKRKVSVTVRKVPAASGYQIGWARQKKNAAKARRTVSGRSLTIRGLRAKKKYYVCARAYWARTDGTRAYGKWSRIKKVTVKK